MTENTKAPYQISEYLEYCDCMAKQPDKSIIEFIESNSGTPRYPREKREEIPQGRGVRLCPMGKRRRYKALHRPGFPKQHHFDADGTAYHEQPPEAAEVREK